MKQEEAIRKKEMVINFKKMVVKDPNNLDSILAPAIASQESLH